MITREELEGKWTQLKGEIRERWGQITDDELQQAHGDVEQLMGFLQRKTGQSRREIEAFITHACAEGQTLFNQAAETARDYAGRASQSIRDGYEEVERRMEEGYEEAQEIVRERPVTSTAAAFGAGLVAGVVISLLLRNSRA